MRDRTPTESSDGAVLVRRMAVRDREALRHFYDRYAPLAYALGLKIVRQPADAAAALEATFWELWRGATGYDRSRGTPEAWVLLRMRARALDRVRAERGGSDAGTAPHPPAVTPAEQVEAVEGFADRVLTRALDRLPDPQREALELAYYGGLTQTEIADRLKQPLGTVRTRLRLGLERLRDTARLVR